jgi:hypothetical protein
MKISWVAEAKHFARAGALGRVLKHLDGSMDWRLASTAPFNCDVELCADESHVVPFPCRQTEDGWINADLNIRLDIAPTEWRAWPAGKGAPLRSAARGSEARRSGAPRLIMGGLSGARWPRGAAITGPLRRQNRPIA